MYELRLDFGPHHMQAQLAIAQSQEMPLHEFLTRFSARPSHDIPPDWLALPLRCFTMIPVQHRAAPPPPPAPSPPLHARLDTIYQEEQIVAPPPFNGTTPHPNTLPDTLTDSEAVARAYAQEIEKIGRYLSNDLSVLVICDKVLAEHIYRHAVRQSNKSPILEGDSDPAITTSSGSAREITTASQRINALGRLLAAMKPDQVLVLRHLDMLAASSIQGSFTLEARLLTEVLYQTHESTPTLLGFADPSVELPKVLADRFAIRIEVAGLHREALMTLVTRSEFERFDSFDHETLFKNVSGFNAIQFRNALRYLKANSQPYTPTAHLMHHIREFKRGSGADVEIPDMTFDQIGGYAEVKQIIFEAIELITGSAPPFDPDGQATDCSANVPIVHESDEARARRRKLAPRGFIFYGPPGTGKTLFAKAIANAMNATIQMVSGPEIMDMWLGKSESNLRQIFAIARRNAPAVIFFDEFDSIAAQRSGFADSASRASNAVVAQLLTELDGFHADQDILVIGTTNRLDIIDQALLRPSRFLPVEIDLPDECARRQIAAIHAQGFDVMPPESDWLDTIAAQTTGFNGDEIRAIFQQAAREVRKGATLSLPLFLDQVRLLALRRTDELLLVHGE